MKLRGMSQVKACLRLPPSPEHIMTFVVLLLDASDQSLTLAWDRKQHADNAPRVVVEEVQMKKALSVAAAAAAGGRGGEESDGSAEWVTLSSSLTSAALRKKNLEAGTAYVFRRRARQDESSSSGAQNAAEPDSEDTQQGWGPWSEPSDPLKTLAIGVQQAPTPAVRLREGGAVLMEWPPVRGAKAYEVQMSTSGQQWATVAPAFSSTLLRKKGLENGTQYRFRIRPVFSTGIGGVSEQPGGGDAWGWSPASSPTTPAVLNSFLSTQLPRELVAGGGDNKRVDRMVLAGKIVAFYFSASWCGPCRQYTPQLVQLYLAAKKQHKAFEIVFVSLDGDESSFKKYHATMPWPAVPYDDAFREDFPAAKGVSSIPRLIVTGQQGQELASNAVGMTLDHLVAWEAQG